MPTKYKIFTEKELESIFSGKKAKKDRLRILNFFKPVILFIITTCVIFVALNFAELKQNLVFWYDTNYKNTEGTAMPDYSQQVLDQITKSVASTSSSLPPLPQIENNYLKIPSINVNAPITWKVTNSPESVSENLKNGLIQIDGTGLPGEKGNIFITGHSSNYPWIQSEYNNVFSLLNKMVIGDITHLKYNGQDYLYKVNNIIVVKPDDLSPMKQTNSSILTLMTCTPVGTSLKRLIVTSKQIYPDPNQNVTNSRLNKNMKMPSQVR